MKGGVKPVSFKRNIREFDACGLAKTTWVTFKGKVMSRIGLAD